VRRGTVKLTQASVVSIVALLVSPMMLAGGSCIVRTPTFDVGLFALAYAWFLIAVIDRCL
jgi:high-affinity nickel permease